MTSIPQVPETIAEMKVIVYKARVDPATLKDRAEEMKNELFLKRFSKPKLKDIQVVSVDKNYDPYVLVDAKYRIEYYTKKVYSIEVTQKTKEVKILGTSFKAQMEAVPGSEPERYHNVIMVEGQEWSDFEDKVYLILDKNGNEISPDQIPIAPSEEQPKQLLNEFSKRTEIVKMSDQEVILLAKTKLIKRPQDADIVDNESFQVTEYATIYNPVYIINFRNEKTKEEKSVRIDGVTGDVIE